MYVGMEWNEIPVTWQNFLNKIMQDISYNIQGCKRASTQCIAYLKLVLPLGPVERSTIGSSCMFGVLLDNRDCIGDPHTFLSQSRS